MSSPTPVLCDPGTQSCAPGEPTLPSHPLPDPGLAPVFDLVGNGLRNVDRVLSSGPVETTELALQTAEMIGAEPIGPLSKVVAPVQIGDGAYKVATAGDDGLRTFDGVTDVIAGVADYVPGVGKALSWGINAGKWLDHNFELSDRLSGVHDDKPYGEVSGPNCGTFEVESQEQMQDVTGYCRGMDALAAGDVGRAVSLMAPPASPPSAAPAMPSTSTPALSQAAISKASIPAPAPPRPEDRRLDMPLAPPAQGVIGM